MQEQQGHVELGVEGEAETFLPRLAVEDRESPLRIEADRVIGGADRLNESVV